jgi:hypothetical protein
MDVLVPCARVNNASHHQISFFLHPLPSSTTTIHHEANSSLELLLWAELVCVSTLLLAAVGCSWRETCVAPKFLLVVVSI